MDVIGPLFHLALRSLVVLFPLTVGWLAFRRLALSKSGNAWIYAAVCLFAAVTTAGILPWTLGLTQLNWLLLMLALVSPAIWIGIVLLCDMSRTNRYGGDPFVDAARSVASDAPRKLAPLLLDRPLEPESPVPVFRHRKVVRAPKEREIGQATRTILALARDIRGNATSERRRPKLLPAPEKKELPFLRESPGA